MINDKWTCLIGVARRNYYNDKLHLASYKLKQIFKILNKLMYRRVAKAVIVHTFPKIEWKSAILLTLQITYFTNKSKLFDSTNHKMLCQKLQLWGILNTALSWIKSYLEYGTQLVQFGSSRCYCLKISWGVPRSSILAPLLFISYVDDLPNVSSQTQSLLFADDTNIFLFP